MENKAFTIVELLVVTSIIVLITALTLPNYRSGSNQLALQRSAHKISQDLRRAQEFAISVKDFNGSAPQGYGIYFDLDQPNRYLMFADLNGDQGYSDSGEKVEEFILENNITLSSLVPVTAGNSLTVIFIPPDPNIVFNPDASLASITLKASGTETAGQYVYNREAGWVWHSGWYPPRASCDISERTSDCPDAFSASQSDPVYVFDWTCYQWWCQNISYMFIKSESQPSSVQQKIIQVNKAGLIAVE